MNNSLEDLEEWRRTHYSTDITPDLEGVNAIIMGWVSSIRDHGNIKFFTISDRFGNMQVTVKKDKCQENLLIRFVNLSEHSSVAIKGVIKAESKSPSGAEITPSELKILSLSKKSPPFMIQSRKEIGLDIRLDLRAVDLRRPYLQSLFNIRYAILESCREFFKNEGFIEVNTPKIISTATEGGAALFPVFYYDREAFLAQSPQLYKEQLTMAFENVFEISPIFRAEPSRTNRHLSEALSLDVEKAFVDYTDIMNLMERMLSHIITRVNVNNKKNLDFLNIILPEIKTPFPKFKYSELIEKLRSVDDEVEWGDDLTFQKLSKIQENDLNNFYFIIDWPASVKPFYVKPKSPNIEESESFDLMFNSLEISSGSTRIKNKEELVERMKKQGLNTNAFEYHLRIFDYGIPPHAGFGMGLERLLMSICDVDNIRDTTFYPRDIDRLTP